ncbi:MAG: ATP-binding cassette domain-containing protein, partial [Alphaproteobacteria bacterium]|nr:ATP-binding cassette domain-containing protein [Alphaproteobacteria bacterium]
MTETSASLSFHSVACLRGDRLLFEGMDFALAAGEAALVAGPNGTGKSSLIRLAAGLLHPAAGHIDRQGRMAMSDENLALDMDKPLRHALDFWARIDGSGDAALDEALA